MTLQSLGTQTADWTTKATLTFGPVPARSDRGVAFVVLQSGPPVITRNQYVVATGLLEYSIGTFETPLESKWFPGVNGQLIVVAVPELDAAIPVNVSLLLFPKEFKPGSRLVDTVQTEVFFDDQYLLDVVVPMG